MTTLNSIIDDVATSEAATGACSLCTAVFPSRATLSSRCTIFGTQAVAAAGSPLFPPVSSPLVPEPLCQLHPCVCRPTIYLVIVTAALAAQVTVDLLSGGIPVQAKWVQDVCGYNDAMGPAAMGFVMTSSGLMATDTNPRSAVDCQVRCGCAAGSRCARD